MSEYLIITGAIICIPCLIGFGASGIVAGSTAAAMQSSIGNVAAGSAFSYFQSLAATGLVA